jgi:hypothetical protein
VQLEGLRRDRPATTATGIHGLTAPSLPPGLALAHTILNKDDWRGLGLLSGSRLSHIATALGLFCTTGRYDSSRRLTLFQAALPGSTEQDPCTSRVAGLLSSSWLLTAASSIT